MKGFDTNEISNEALNKVYAIAYTSWNSEIVGALLEEATKELINNGVNKKNIFLSLIHI